MLVLASPSAASGEAESVASDVPVVGVAVALKEAFVSQKSHSSQ